MVVAACRADEPELRAVAAEGNDPAHLSRCFRADEV
jgi:hypothetical protein